MHTYTLTFGAVRFGRSPFRCSYEKREKSLNGFRFGTSLGRFSSGGAAGTAVKGLSVHPALSTAVKGLKTFVSHGDIYRTIGTQSGVSYDVT